MNKETQSIVVGLLGGLLISITLSGRFTSYVKPGFAPYLLVAGSILVLVGVVSLVLTIRADARAQRAAVAGSGHAEGHGDAPRDVPSSVPEDDAHGHDHDASRAPWLILVPVLVLLLVAPPALGADAVARNAGSQALNGAPTAPQPDAAGPDGVGTSAGGYKFNDGSGSVSGTTSSSRTMTFPPLAVGPDPELSFKDFVLRALYDKDGSVDGTPVTLTGFLAPAGDGFAGGYTIARMTISCCAADANPMQVHVEGASPYPPNTWVRAVVTALPNTGTLDNGYVPTVTVASLTPVNQPADPYEH